MLFKHNLHAQKRFRLHLSAVWIIVICQLGYTLTKQVITTNSRHITTNSYSGNFQSFYKEVDKLHDSCIFSHLPLFSLQENFFHCSLEW